MGTRIVAVCTFCGFGNLIMEARGYYGAADRLDSHDRQRLSSSRIARLRAGRRCCVCNTSLTGTIIRPEAPLPCRPRDPWRGYDDGPTIEELIEWWRQHHRFGGPLPDLRGSI